MKWFHKIMPREEKFFVLFDRHAVCIRKAAGTLQDILKGGPQVKDLCARLMAEEEEADHISHEVLEAIRRSFITPFDRSDIKALITAMDDSIDQMNKTAKTIILYDVTEFEETMRQMGEVIVRTADLTAEIVPMLKNMAPNAQRIHDLTRKAVAYEDETDHLHDAGLKALYHGKGRKDPMAFIIGSEIYEHLEKVGDRLEDVASHVNGILIEHM
jgi:predicted phosphate transport protein (TIGR00153 family)